MSPRNHERMALGILILWATLIIGAVIGVLVYGWVREHRSHTPSVSAAQKVVVCTAGIPGDPQVRSQPSTFWVLADSGIAFYGSQWSRTRAFHVPEGYDCAVEDVR